MTERLGKVLTGTFWGRALIVAGMLVVATPSTEIRTQAITSTTGKTFFYFASGQSLPQHADHVSVTVNYDGAHVIDELQALAPDLKMIVPAFYVLAGDGCSLNPNWFQDWSGAANLLTPYLNKIAAVGITDEPDLRADQCFQQEPNAVQRQVLMVQLMEQASNIVKYTVPGWAGVKTWVNYGTEFRSSGVPLAQNVDWSSFDCYGPFNNCFGSGYSIPQLVDIMASKLPNPQTQSMFLISDASCFFYDATGRKTHESELFIRALEYWQLAATHPRLNGMIGFIWEGESCNYLPPVDSVNAINDSPGLSALYRNIGLNLLTGAVPAISSLSVPTECVIPIGGSTCTVNMGWTTTSGPNVGAYARLVGNQDVVYGPLCPGATSCAMPAGVGDYIIELRENWWDVNSKLIYARATKIRHGNSAPTGQITFTPSVCKKIGGHCLMALTANVQNAPSAAFFLAGAQAPLCPAGRANLCAMDGALLPSPGPHSFTVQLRANGAVPNSQLLEQRTFSVTVTQ